MEKRKGKPYWRWVNDYWTARGKPLDFVRHKHLIQLYKDQYPDIVYKKSGQAGLTERLITEALWLPDQFKENSIFYFPTSGLVGDLVQERVDEPLNANDYLRSISRTNYDYLKYRKVVDKVGLKKMSKGFVYFRGAQTTKQVKSVSGDCVFIDEIDEIDPVIIPYIDKRLLHSDRKWKRIASTPTYPNVGIDKIFGESDQHFCYLKCTHCGEWQVLDFFINVDQEKEMLVCKKCHGKIIPWDCKLNWIANKPDSEKRGYSINQLYSPFCNIHDVIQNSKRTTEYEIQQFYNQDLGLAYEPKGSKITEKDLDSCKRHYTCPAKSDEAFIGIDVGRMLHYVIIDKEKFLHCGEVKTFTEIEHIIDEFDIKCGVIDALPETRKAQELCNAFRGRIYICYYSGMKEVKDREWFKVSETDGEYKINTDRTISLDVSQNLIKKQKIKLPKNLELYPDFINHCKNLSRVIKKDSTESNVKIEYIRVGDDHLRHAFNYANIARHIFDRIPEPEICII